MSWTLCLDDVVFKKEAFTLIVKERASGLSMGFSRQIYWSGLPCPPPGDLPNPGMEPVSLMSPAIGRQVLYH